MSCSPLYVFGLFSADPYYFNSLPVSLDNKNKIRYENILINDSGYGY